MATKQFDCIEMKRKGAEAVRAKIAGMTREQELAFWRERTEKLRQRREAAKAERERKAG